MIAPANPLGEPPGLKEHFDIFGGMFEEKNLQNIFVTASVNTSVDFKSLFTLGHYEPVERLFPEGDTEAKFLFLYFSFFTLRKDSLKEITQALKLIIHSFIFNLC